MDKQISVGRDFDISKYQLTLEELEDWILGARKILEDHPEYHTPQVEFSSDDGDYSSEIYLTVYRPETEQEKSYRESQEEYNKKQDRRRFDSYKEKYGW